MSCLIRSMPEHCLDWSTHGNASHVIIWDKYGVGKNIANCSKNPQYLPEYARCHMLRTLWGRLKRSARAVQLFGRLAVLETHTLRY